LERLSKGIWILQAIKAVEDVFVMMGIYPKASTDENGIRKERTERQDGWNDCVIKLSEKVRKQLDSLKDINEDLALLMLADVGWSEEGKLYLNMNDTFYHGADSEMVEKEEFEAVAILFKKYGYPGLTYWVATKRGSYPEIAKYKKEVHEIRKKEGEV
jgi:hypothetical protein